MVGGKIWADEEKVEVFVWSMVFGIVYLVCSVVPGHVVVWFIAVPRQHAAFEHFVQTGAAVHPALCRPSMPSNKKVARVIYGIRGCYSAVPVSCVLWALCQTFNC
jgi:hypothetical protein